MKMGSAYGLAVSADTRLQGSARDLFTSRKLGMAVSLAALAAAGALTASLLPRPQSAAPPNITFLTPVPTTIVQSSQTPHLTAPAP